jgi:hypothetical protein
MRGVSYYEGLPDCKSAMDIIVLLERVTQRFPNRHKYALGARLLDTATDCSLWVARAQRRRGRLQALDRLGCSIALAVERCWPRGALNHSELRYPPEPVGSELTDQRSPAGDSA